MDIFRKKKTEYDKMKILHIIDNMSMGGANSLLVSLVPAEIALGNDVDVLELVRAKDRTLTDKLKLSGVNVLFMADKGSVYNPLLIFKAMRYLKNYDIVHVHLFPALYWVGFAKMLSCSRTPLVYTEHSTSNKRRNNSLLRAIDKFVYSNCYKEVIACSDKAQETFNQCFSNVQVTTISNGVDVRINANAEPYSKRELLGIEENCFVATMIARFASMKRQDTIVRAIARLPEMFHAVFVGGDGGYMDKVKELAKSLEVADRVHFLGVRPDVPRILKSSDVIVMASDYEGLSLSSIEGMAAGRPFIASNVNGLREVVAGAGVLFENKDDAALASVIEKLYTDNDFYELVSARCASRAKEYDISHCAESYVNEYLKFMNR